MVLSCETHVLYPRLESRGYSDIKIKENMSCEIMQVVLDEARSSYAHDIVIQLHSNSVDDMEGNVDRIQTWIDEWVSSR